MRIEELSRSLAEALSATAGRSLAPRRFYAAAGGCIHRAFVLETDGGRFFVKANDDPRAAAMFAAEADGLEALAAAGIRVPRPLARGGSAGIAWLALEYLPLRERGDGAALGRLLAALHRVRSERYGWRQDNFIGTVAQPNAPSGDWTEFWRTQRLAPQLALAAKNRLPHDLIALGERLCEALPRLLSGQAPTPVLLHGDLWRGNAAFLADGAPVVFDPAVYYGDAEADLAMTELFGGFPAEFYRAYREIHPERDGYRLRRTLYNLYHVLNHANLFGGAYAAQARAMIERLLAETR